MEDDGSWSAVALNLPGAGSCGANKDEVVENVREAIAGCILSYREDGEPVPIEMFFQSSHPITPSELAVIIIEMTDV